MKVLKLLPPLLPSVLATTVVVLLLIRLYLVTFPTLLPLPPLRLLPLIILLSKFILITLLPFRPFFQILVLIDVFKLKFLITHPSLWWFLSTDDSESVVARLTDLNKYYLDSAKCYYVLQSYQEFIKRCENRNWLKKSVTTIVTRMKALLASLWDGRLSVIIKPDIKIFKINKWTDYINSPAPKEKSLGNYQNRLRKLFTPIRHTPTEQMPIFNALILEKWT